MAPKGHGYLLVSQVLRTDVIEQEHDAPLLLLLGLAPFRVLPVRTPWRCHEDLLFFVPSRFQKAFSRQRQPTGFATVSTLKVHVEQIFDGSVDGGPEGSSHARLARESLATQPVHAGAGLVPIPC